MCQQCISNENLATIKKLSKHARGVSFQGRDVWEISRESLRAIMLVTWSLGSLGSMPVGHQLLEIWHRSKRYAVVWFLPIMHTPQRV